MAYPRAHSRLRTLVITVAAGADQLPRPDPRRRSGRAGQRRDLRVQHRAEDQSGAASAWAPDCRFTIDTTAPKPPVVTSADYPGATAGVESDTRSYDFTLRSHRPTGDSADYPAWENSGGAGVAGTFAFHPALDGVTAYTYVIDNAGPRTIQADATGTATLPWTPTAEQTGWHYLQVREHLAPRLGVANATDGRRSGGDSWDVSPRRRSRCPCRPSR